jgi:hypothetical protein
MVSMKDVDPHEIAEIYDNSHLQQACFDVIRLTRRYEFTQDDTYLEQIHEAAMRGYELLPFDSLVIEGKETDSPTEVMYVVAIHMKELDLVDFGEYQPKE